MDAPVEQTLAEKEWHLAATMRMNACSKQHATEIIVSNQLMSNCMQTERGVS